MMEAWKIISLMDIAKRDGRIVETNVYGFAASGGFLIFASGSKGYRIASPRALLMWHEVWSFKMFSVETPSDKEEEAKTLRFF